MKINKWLDMLPSNQREIVIYRAIKDMQFNRVARACRYSEVRAKELYYKAINNIQKEEAKA
jgi:DNA-directed RNA polymerase specialized sigma24 family protein